MAYSKPGGNFWVATPRLKPTEMVGIVGLESQDANAGKLRRMSVKENYRRRGVGHLLIQVLEDWAKKHGYHKIWLGAGTVMEKARAFYSSEGYTQTKTFVINEDPHIEGVVSEKTLDNDAIRKNTHIA
ncbi:hypothetical protein L916_19570 [Phytophthora nicotianae]|uniref:N-acetyltransferase domain-containing protein n=1 Tax=Phytophthora nicotianae TaxID=4792 RepID=W2I010_PHYNI|nr:hypothetical protein L916_19570 [Phytophthora nicotianae]